MLILVTGGSGFVGRMLCAEMALTKHLIRLALRKINLRLSNFDQCVVGSLNGTTDWSGPLANVDVVIHMAARAHVMKDTSIDPLAEFRKVNVDATLNLAIQASQAGVKRFIYISSVKVNGESTELGKPFREDDNANPEDAYGLSKFEAEQGLLIIAKSSGMEVVIIRPPLIYGPGVKANFKSILLTLKLGLPMPLAHIYNKRSFVYVGNLVSLIICCINHPAAANHIFLVSDGCDLSTTSLLKKCAMALGVQARLFAAPHMLMLFCAKFLGKRDVASRIYGNLQVDISKSHQLLGWTPPISVEEGLLLTVEVEVQ